MSDKVWDFSKKKWLLWTGIITFFILGVIYLWFTAIIMSFFERKKPKMKDYKVYKTYQKFMIVSGNILLVIVIIVILLLLLFPGQG